MSQTFSEPTPPALPRAGLPPRAADEPGLLPYAPPTLQRYGAVSDLTRTVGTVGRRDGRRSRRRTGY